MACFKVYVMWAGQDWVLNVLVYMMEPVGLGSAGWWQKCTTTGTVGMLSEQTFHLPTTGQIHNATCVEGTAFE